MKRVDGYAPLSAYGMLGDGHAGALVAADGAIDWFATPRLDAPPVCAALLDPSEGGAFELHPVALHTVSHRYVPGTLLHETTFSCSTGTVRVTDSLNRGPGGPLPWTELARRIDGISGQVSMRWTVRPGHQLTSARPWARWSRGLPRIDVGEVQLAIVDDGMAPELIDGSAFGGEIIVRSRDRRLLGVVASRKALWNPTATSVQARVDSTADHWRQWSGGIRYHGPHACTAAHFC